MSRPISSFSTTSIDFFWDFTLNLPLMFENVLELSRYISNNTRTIEFKISDITISRNDTIDVQNKIKSIDPEIRKALKINNSTLWYQQKKIKQGKIIKMHNKTKGRMNASNGKTND